MKTKENIIPSLSTYNQTRLVDADVLSGREYRRLRRKLKNK